MRALTLVVLALSLFLGVQAAINCGTFGTQEGQYCNCHAGAAPNYSNGAGNCNLPAGGPSGCGSATDDEDLVSGTNAPTFDPADISIANDRLIIKFKQTVVTNSAWGRTKTNIKFFSGNSKLTGIPGSPTCSYPGPMWTKTTGSCSDEYTFSMPWSSYFTCGFKKDVTMSTLTYSAVVEIEYIEGVTVSRTLSNLFNFNIQLARQKSVEALLNLQLDAPSDASVSAMIVGSSAYDVLNGNIRVVVQTQTSWPYKIASPLGLPYNAGPTVNSHPTDTVVTIAPDYLTPDSCPTSPNSLCTQHFEIIIKPSSTANPPLCDLRGTYTFDVELICSDVETCTPTPGPSIEISLDQTDICIAPVLDTSVAAEQSLLSFDDSSFSGPSVTAFEIGDTVWWSFSVVDPGVSIDSLTLNSISLSIANGDISDPVDIIFSKLTNTQSLALVNPKEVTGVIVPPGTKASVSFGIVLNRSILDTIKTLEAGNSIKAFNLEVVVDIVHHGNKKRSVVAADNMSSGVAKFVVKAKNAGNNSNCTGYACSAISWAKRAVGY